MSQLTPFSWCSHSFIATADAQLMAHHTETRSWCRRYVAHKLRDKLLLMTLIMRLLAAGMYSIGMAEAKGCDCLELQTAITQDLSLPCSQKRGHMRLCQDFHFHRATPTSILVEKKVRPGEDGLPHPVPRYASDCAKLSRQSNPHRGSGDRRYADRPEKVAP